MEKLTYLHNNTQIEQLPYFLYEVSIYEITKYTAGILSTKYYTSNEYISIKPYVKRFQNFILERSVTLLGAPESFVTKLPIYKKK